MNRKIAAVLVALSILAGVGLGYLVQEAQNTPASAAPTAQPSTPKPTDEPTVAVPPTGPVAVSDASLVASQTGGATLVATVEGATGAYVDDVTATIDGRALPVAIGYAGDAIDSLLLGDEPLRIGGTGEKRGSEVYNTPTYVVHDVAVGQNVQVTIEFDTAPDTVVDVPVVSADQVDDVALFEGPAPEVTDAKIVVFPGSDRAQVSYTAVSKSGQGEATELDRVTATDAAGDPMEWKHQTGTGGPPSIYAPVKPEPVPVPSAPASTQAGETGDYDYVDADRVSVGDTITVRFAFASGVSTVDFHVVAG